MHLKERINEFTTRMKDENIDAAVFLNQNNIRYFTDFVMNQASESVLVIEQDGTVSFLVPKLDYERAIRDCWIDRIDSYAEDTPDYLSPLRQLINSEWRSVGIEKSSITVHHLAYIEDIFKGKLKSIDSLVEQQMKIKSKLEIELLRKSANIASYTMNRVMEYILKTDDVTEREATGYAQYIMEKNGAENYSFQPFMMSGTDSALPRRVSTNKKLTKGELIVFDMGCVYKGYCSDITRTFSLGQASEKQKEIYHISYEAQKKSIEAIKPGRSAEEIDAIARDYITKHGYGEYFPHLTGHGLGLNIHEYPILDVGEKAILEAGMVITMEPGIYLPNVGAVRIEDMILVTDDGYEYLTDSPRDLILK